MWRWMSPHETISDQETAHGLNLLMVDSTCSQMMNVLVGGAFLVAFALALGASNTVIGLLSALNPLSQILQIPAIFLIEWTALRKATTVIASFSSRLLLLVIAALPWVVPVPYRLPILLCALSVFFGLAAISALAYNSWMRDFIPIPIFGAYTGKRAAIATVVGAALSLLAAVGVDALKPYASELTIYSGFFLLGATVGLLGMVFLSRVPEPRMVKNPSQSLGTILREPFRDANFRKVLIFLGTWNFVVNLAAPFFAVYMLKQLRLSMTIVLVLSVISQMANVVFFQLWGRLADRFSNKSVLSVTGPLFMLSVLMFSFTTPPGWESLILPLLVVIHILTGISSAGVMLCTGNIAIELAPKGKATSYLATNALISGIAATIAPILGGLGADWFARRELMVILKWVSPIADRNVEVPAMVLQGLDFLFLFACLLSFYVFHRLALIQEEGEVEEEIIMRELSLLVRRSLRSVSTAAEIYRLFEFPYARLMEFFSPQAPPPHDSDLLEGDML